MASKSISSAKHGKADSKNGRKPPYDDFPLSHHPPSGRLHNKTKGKRYYFGYASDWRAAIDKYEHEREAPYSGREPRLVGDGLTINDLCNRFLTSVKGHEPLRSYWTRSFTIPRRGCLWDRAQTV